jgi:DNA polymerase-3 subunit alpha (Gram-positive type)
MSIIDDYVALDIESTGLNPKYEKIIEIGAARVRKGEITDTFSTFVNPARNLPAAITELTKIRNEDVSGAPYIDEIIDKVIEFIGDDVLLGHNLIFDYSFVKKAAINQKKDFDKNGIDTLKIARRFLNSLESRKLGDLCEYYNIPLEAHRALNDAIAAHKLYKRLAADFAAKEEALFIPKPLVYNVKKESPITPRQLELLKQLAQRYGISCEGNILDMGSDIYIDMSKATKNEASRIIDKINSSYAAINHKNPS